ncbi:hypothetical protein HGRIS_009393 [Hohenbuehelia grisea]|uniref:Uncharacterized protein n=1 Tax=Hohenbuehelia grisea TaxID=104357 RepID=A0ABR3J165_9AGAR
MDDDMDFGAAVWSTDAAENTSAPESPLEDTPAASFYTAEPQFNDFDDFADSADVAPADGDDDDFGDFGDFEETADTLPTPVDFGGGPGFGVPGPSAPWQPLHLDPFPPRRDLEESVGDIIAPIWDSDGLSGGGTNEGIREVEGISQILVFPESRDLYTHLVKFTPPTKPPNWIRSRIRRQHLIALGIPVNLDEVLPHANGKPLPPLQITTRPMSAPPGPRNPPGARDSLNIPRSGTPQPSGRPTPSPKPTLDEPRVSALLDLSLESLTLKPLGELERILADIRSQTANTSALLTYLLQTRDALQQDSETYNKLIAELVGEAQKIKTGKGRKGSGMS